MENASAILPTESAIQVLLATKYLGAAGLICVLYDHILTIPDEFIHIWMRKKWDIVKIIFLLNRYSNEAALCYSAYIFTGLHSRGQLDQKGCVDFMTVLSTLGVVSVSTANVFMTLRHYALWDRRRRAMIALWVAFAISYSAIFVLFIFTVRSLRESALYSPLLETCLLTSKSLSLVSIWGCMLAFDVFTLSLAITNALERPYRHHVEVIVNFQRDGAIFFLALTSLRIINLTFAVVGVPDGTFLVTLFVWGMISLTLSRLILRVESIKAQTSHMSLGGIHMYEMDQWRSAEQ